MFSELAISEFVKNNTVREHYSHLFLAKQYGISAYKSLIT